MPTRQAIVADITCDSDGKIDRFIDLHDVKRILPVHKLNDEEYYLGVFLTGAYQETLGDMHNLLGAANVLHVRTDESGETRITREEYGDSVENVLSYVEYDPKLLLQRIRDQAGAATSAGRITRKEKNRIISAYIDGMKGYTYFER
jgi:arginine decarboxylase